MFNHRLSAFYRRTVGKLSPTSQRCVRAILWHVGSKGPAVAVFAAMMKVGRYFSNKRFKEYADRVDKDMAQIDLDAQRRRDRINARRATMEEEVGARRKEAPRDACEEDMFICKVCLQKGRHR